MELIQQIMSDGALTMGEKTILISMAFMLASLWWRISRCEDRITAVTADMADMKQWRTNEQKTVDDALIQSLHGGTVGTVAK